MKRLAIIEPKLSAYEIKLNLDEKVDFLSLGRWIIQRHKGHKASSDDQLLAWALYQSRLNTPPKRVLELGAGKGTISLILSALWPKTIFIGIEAFRESYELSLKNRLLNHLEDRFFPLFGDFRDTRTVNLALSYLEQTESLDSDPNFLNKESSSQAGFELICGAPPFMPIGSGVMPQDPQRASGRFEIKGGVEAYLQAINKLLAPNPTSRAFLLMDGQNHQRSRKAIAQVPSLKLIGHCKVLSRPNQAPTYEIFELARSASTSSQVSKYKRYSTEVLHPLPPTLPPALCQREKTGEQWTDTYQLLREQLGLQVPNLPWIFIPARLNSTRLKHKALASIHGQTLIRRVLHNLSQLTYQLPLVLVSDSFSILEQAQYIDHSELHTQLITQTCDSGSQRILRAYENLRQQIKSDWIINVQGDEPFLPLESVEALIEALPHFARQGIYIATLASPLATDPVYLEQQLNTLSTVKVCLADFGLNRSIKPQHPSCSSWQKALFFTRQATGTHQHIGVYAFHRDAFHLLDKKRGSLAQSEDLEQLTWLESGADIGVVCLKHRHLPGIDTAQDLERAQKYYQESLTESPRPIP